MKRFLFSLFLVVLMVFALSAKTLTLSTKHFDIIYEEESVRVAKVLYDHLEEEYQDLVSFFGTDPKMHLPIYVTTEYKDFNAYFTAYPYSRIVIFDTVPDLMAGLSNADDTILLTTKHELTHAFTQNLRGPVLDVLHHVLGDPYSLTEISQYQSFIEGIAVTVESKDGMGRLHSPLMSATLKQAKLEGKKVSYMEASGARDISPKGALPYYFGGNFLNYVGEHYGEEKLGELFNYLGTIHPHFLPGNFKRVIGTPLKNAWNLFLDSVPVPNKVVEPTLLTKDYGTYNYLTIQNGTIYGYDDKNYSIFALNEEDHKKSLFHYHSASNNISVSEDGYFLVPVIMDEYSAVRIIKDSSVLPYGVTIHTFKDYRDGSFGVVNGKTVILLYRVEDQMAYLDLYSSDYELLSTLALGYGVIGDKYAYVGDGKIAFILSNNGNQNIAILSLEDMTLCLVEDRLGLQYSSFSATNDGHFYFGYVEKADKAALSRYGEGVVKKDSVEVCYGETNFNGGVYYPARKGDDIYFVSKFFHGSKLSKATVEEMCMDELMVLSYEAYTPEPEPTGLEALVATSSSYHPWKYFRKGFVLPLVSSKNLYLETEKGLGFFYNTSDPTETYDLTFNIGRDFDVEETFASVDFIYNNKARVSLTALNIGQNPVYEIDAEVLLSKSLHTEKENLGAIDSFAYVTDGEEYILANKLTVSYENLAKFGFGRHNLAGFILEGILNYEYSSDEEESYYQPMVAGTFYLPQLLPFSSTPYDTFNLPTILSVTYAPMTQEMVYEGKTYLWTHEVQKSITFLGLYLRNLDVYGLAEGYYSFPNKVWDDQQYSVHMEMNFVPVIGELYRKVSASFGAGLTFVPGESPKLGFEWALKY